MGTAAAVPRTGTGAAPEERSYDAGPPLSPVRRLGALQWAAVTTHTGPATTAVAAVFKLRRLRQLVILVDRHSHLGQSWSGWGRRCGHYEGNCRGRKPPSATPCAKSSAVAREPSLHRPLPACGAVTWTTPVSWGPSVLPTQTKFQLTQISWPTRRASQRLSPSLQPLQQHPRSGRYTARNRSDLPAGARPAVKSAQAVLPGWLSRGPTRSLILASNALVGSIWRFRALPAAGELVRTLRLLLRI
mmetsp:Transcript_2516/g.5287  ORF Transcript_2516/g.5287 Transcript_2516/m.5287 type:complete len:245 (+) Transcript_2516:747-1481(+)